MRRFLEMSTYVVVAAIPITFRVQLLENEKPLIASKVPAVDLVLLFAFSVWILAILLRRAPRSIVLPPAPVWALVAVAILSAFVARRPLDSLKEIIQLADYFLIAYILVTNGLVSRRHLVRLGVAFGIVVSGVALYAVYQQAILGDRAYLVSSVFDDRHVLGGFMATALPLFFGLFLGARDRRLKASIAAPLVLGMLVVGSVASYLILFVVFCFMAVRFGGRPALLLGVITLFVLMLLIRPGLHWRDFGSPANSFFEPEGISAYRKTVRRTVAMAYVPPVTTITVGAFRVHVASSMATPVEIPDEWISHQLNARSKDELYAGGHLIQRLLEWQAGLNVLRDHPVMGVGVGNYQSEIGHYFGALPKLNTLEPNTQNGYLVTAATMGLMGIGVFLWVLIFFLRLSNRVARGHTSPVSRGLALGLTGSLVAFALNNFFAPLMHQVTVLPFALLLAVVSWVVEPGTDHSESNTQTRIP